MSKNNQAKVKALWKSGRNVWEISQLTGIPELDICGFVRTV